MQESNGPDLNLTPMCNMKINQVNYKNATFAGTYGVIRNGTISKFPLCGEFDPTGTSIGWVVSYQNEDINDHAVGVWSRYALITPASE